MLSNHVSTLKLGGIEYPFKCDLIVLEKVQEKYEDLVKVEDGLRGFIPRIDADGVIDRSIGNMTLPNVGMVCQILTWMVEEGIEITGSEIEVPDPNFWKRQDELTLSELGIIVYTDFEECIGGRGRKKKTTKPKKWTDTGIRRTRPPLILRGSFMWEPRPACPGRRPVS